MSVLGIDVSTRSVDFVLLSDDDNTAEWLHWDCPKWIRERGAVFAARHFASCVPGRASTWWEREAIWLVALEDPHSRWPHTAKALGLVTGVVVARIPETITVVPTAPKEWKRVAVGDSEASKATVKAWAIGEGFEPPMMTEDCADAYAVARAVRTLNEGARAA